MLRQGPLLPLLGGGRRRRLRRRAMQLRARPSGGTMGMSHRAFLRASLPPLLLAAAVRQACGGGMLRAALTPWLPVSAESGDLPGRHRTDYQHAREASLRRDARLLIGRAVLQ